MDREKRRSIAALGGSADGGAASMIKFGALEGVDACFALHVLGSLPTGCMRVSRDRAMASCDMFKLDICGSGGHGSAPEAAIDPVGALAAILAAYNAFPARELPAQETCVLSIGVITTDSTWNVIPDKIHVEGGVRAFDPALRSYVMERLPQIAEGICGAHRCRAEFEHVFGVAPTVNNPEISGRMVRVADHVLGEGKAVLVPEPMMGSEDVGFFFQRVPGAIGWLGCKGEGMEPVEQHNPRFRVDLTALRQGVLFHVNMALDFLNEE